MALWLPPIIKRLTLSPISLSSLNWSIEKIDTSINICLPQSIETIKSGTFKDILSPDRALTDEEKNLLQSLIDSSYEQFVKAVAEGRKISEEKVREFADGRVFTGAQAKELGLVDGLVQICSGIWY